MFDTQKFRKMLAETFSTAVSAKSLIRYDDAIIDELQKIAVKVASKTSADSAKTIAEQAAAIAQGAGRPYITWADVEYAIELRHCTVFPFCIGES